MKMLIFIVFIMFWLQPQVEERTLVFLVFLLLSAPSSMQIVQITVNRLIWRCLDVVNGIDSKEFVLEDNKRCP